MPLHKPLAKISSHYLPKLDYNTYEKVPNLAEKNSEYGLSVVAWFGHRIFSFDEKLQNRVRFFAEKNAFTKLGHKLGNSIGYNFPYDMKLQDAVLTLAEGNNMFTVGLGNGLGRNFAMLHKNNVRERIFGLMNMDDKFAFNFAYSIVRFKFCTYG